MKSYYHLNQGSNVLENLEEDTAKQKISLFLKEILRKKENLSIFIGSGCSSGCVPMMGQTIRKLRTDSDIDNIITRYSKEILEIVEPEDPSKLYNEDFSDIESLLNWLQTGISYLGKPDKDELFEILTKIKSGFIQTIPTQNDSTYDTDARKCNKHSTNHTMNLYEEFYRILFSYRNNIDPKISVFSTNYDLFNEYALERNNILYTTGFSTGLDKIFDINNFHYRLVDDTNRYKDKWQPTNKSANLYKIHGSINWNFDSVKSKVVQVGSDSHISDSNLIAIYPTAMKHHETAQHPYSELFREFSIQLQRPNSTLVVMGYGFPDEHINNIIAQNIPNEDFNLIIFGNYEESKCRDFYNSYSKFNNIHLIGGQFSGSGSKINYFDSIIDFLKN